MTLQQRPALTFDGVSEIVDPAVSNWLTDHLPFVLPNTASASEGHLTSSILAFLLRDRIKESLAQLLENQPVTYRRPESVGLPLAARRERIAILNEELANLKSEKAEIEGQIARLKRSAA